MSNRGRDESVNECGVSESEVKRIKDDRPVLDSLSVAARIGPLVLRRIEPKAFECSQKTCTSTSN